MRCTCELHPSLPLAFLCHHKGHPPACQPDGNGHSGRFSDYHFQQRAPATLHFSISGALLSAEAGVLPRKMQRPRAHGPSEFC